MPECLQAEAPSKEVWSDMVNGEKKTPREAVITLAPLIFLTRVRNQKFYQMSMCCVDSVSTLLSAFVTYFRSVPCICHLRFRLPPAQRASHHGVPKVPHCAGQILGQSIRSRLMFVQLKLNKNIYGIKNQCYGGNLEDQCQTVFICEMDHKLIPKKEKKEHVKWWAASPCPLWKW